MPVVLGMTRLAYVEDVVGRTGPSAPTSATYVQVGATGSSAEPSRKESHSLAPAPSEAHK
jgi:hypothetical protein